MQCGSPGSTLRVMSEQRQRTGNYCAICGHELVAVTTIDRDLDGIGHLGRAGVTSCYKSWCSEHQRRKRAFRAQPPTSG